MQLRFLGAFCALIATTTVFAAAAAADPPVRSTEDVTGDEIVCGETALTITAGKLVFREHVHKLGSGLFRASFRGVPKRVRLTDGETTYRAVGSFGGWFVLRDPDDEDSAVSGFFRLKVNIVGRGGLLGTVHETERLKRNGKTVTRDRGTCTLDED